MKTSNHTWLPEETPHYLNWLEERSNKMTDCIVWIKAKAGNGYGVTTLNGKQEYVHRIAAIEKFGSIPDGYVVAHTCDVPSCYNPDHLFICTQAENLADMKRKGRSAKGEKHRSKKYPEKVLKGTQIGNSKLNEQIVLEIRSKYVTGTPGNLSTTSLSGIAKQYGIAFQTVSKIINRKAWKHV